MSCSVSVPPPGAQVRPFVKVKQAGFDRLERLASLEGGSLLLRLYLFLARYADRENALVASNEVLGECLGVGVRTIQRAVSGLRQAGALHVIRVGTTNCYLLSEDEVWRDAEHNERFCAFRVRALVGYSENPGLRETVRRVQAQPDLPGVSLSSSNPLE